MVDDAVCILETKGPEYRVAWVESIKNIFGDLDDDTLDFSPNTTYIQQVFDSSCVFFTYTLALNEAKRIAATCMPLEHGIIFVDNFRRTAYLDF